MRTFLSSTGFRVLYKNFGTSVRFDGSKHILAGTEGTLDLYNTSASNRFSLSFWYYWSGRQTTGYIFNESRVSTSSNYALIHSNKKIQLWVRNEANSYSQTFDSNQDVFNDPGWYHIVWTDNNGTTTLYSNGVEKSLGSMNYPRQTLIIDRTAIGVRGSTLGSNSVHANIDDFKVFKGIILTQAQVDNLRFRHLDPQVPDIYYNFDEGSGTTINNVSGGGNNGVLNTTSFSTRVPFSPRAARSRRRITQAALGESLLLNGTAGNVAVPDAAHLQLTGDYTFSTWIFARGFGEGTAGKILSRFNGVNGFDFSLDATSQTMKVQHNGSSALCQTRAIPLNKWVHIAASYSDSGNTVTFYRDGQLVGAPVAQATNHTSVGAILYVGNRAADDRTFNGFIHQPLIFNSALSATQVQELFTEEWARNSVTLASLVFYGIVSTTSFPGFMLDVSSYGNFGTVTTATVSTLVPYGVRAKL